MVDETNICPKCNLGLLIFQSTQEKACTGCGRVYNWNLSKVIRKYENWKTTYSIKQISKPSV